jgi:hypothetical protein
MAQLIDPEARECRKPARVHEASSRGVERADNQG